MRAHAAAVVAAGLLLGACLRIAATYSVFNQTWDEPAHIATGLEWLQRGRYDFEPLHPPAARVAVALGPYLGGARLTPDDANPWTQTARILGTGAAYFRMLALARVANLAFFLVAGVALFCYVLRALGRWPAAVSILLLSTVPPFLGHAGLATTDVALAAGVMVSLTVLILWLDQPSRLRGVLLGAAIGGTVLTKFSALLLLPLIFAVTIATCRLCDKLESPTRKAGVPLHRLLRPVWLTALVVLWTGYRFSVGPIVPVRGPQHCESSTPCLADSLPPAVAALATAPVYPAPEFVRGLVAYAREGRTGRKAYLLGRRTFGGWWYFFPIAIAIKTPLPFLVLTVVGTAALVVARNRSQAWLVLAAGASAGAILLALIPSRVNIGLRHALAVYPLLSAVAAYGVSRLWQLKPHLPARSLLVGLLAWQVVDSVRAAPDFVAYFNELAPGPPEQYLVDSDLDWGQDLHRLADTLRARGIGQVALAYNGSADPGAVGIEGYRWLRPFTRDTGWIAVSVFALEVGIWNQPTWDDYAWLRSRQPVARAGRSILLYRVVPDTIQ